MPVEGRFHLPIDLEEGKDGRQADHDAADGPDSAHHGAQGGQTGECDGRVAPEVLSEDDSQQDDDEYRKRSMTCGVPGSRCAVAAFPGWSSRRRTRHAWGLAGQGKWRTVAHS